MRIVELYNPFEKLDLSGSKCFLTGDQISMNSDFIYVFPKWIMDSENLYDQPFKLLDETYKTYADLKIPVSKNVKLIVDNLNSKIESYFKNDLNENTINELEWFQWSGLIVYGLVYNEIRFGLKSEEFKEEGFKISPTLIEKFKNLHIQLQSLLYPFEWDNTLPFSLFNFTLTENVSFEHRNEINTLTFSFKFRNKALLICLQDAENNKFYHKNILSKMENNLHPIQFAELEARVYYSNYLLSVLPQFNTSIINNSVYITNVEQGISNRPTFEKWDEKTYSQVLEAFWKKWGISRIEIFKNAEKCMSYLFDEEKNFISKIQL